VEFATAGQKEIPKCRARSQQGRKATGREGKEPFSLGAVKQRSWGLSLGQKRTSGPAYRQGYSPPTLANPRWADKSRQRE